MVEFINTDTCYRIKDWNMLIHVKEFIEEKGDTKANCECISLIYSIPTCDVKQFPNKQWFRNMLTYEQDIVWETALNKLKSIEKDLNKFMKNQLKLDDKIKLINI